MSTRFKFALLLGLAMLATPSSASPAVSPIGNGGPRVARFGLGENFPVSEDVAADSNWKVYEFERDGIRYVQANDSQGNVRLAVGRIDGTFWVLPTGIDADRVHVPGNATVIPIYASARRVHGTDALELWLYQTSSGDWWAVKPVPQ